MNIVTRQNIHTNYGNIPDGVVFKVDVHTDHAEYFIKGKGMLANLTTGLCHKLDYYNDARIFQEVKLYEPKDMPVLRRYKEVFRGNVFIHETAMYIKLSNCLYSIVQNCLIIDDYISDDAYVWVLPGFTLEAGPLD